MGRLIRVVFCLLWACGCVEAQVEEAPTPGEAHEHESRPVEEGAEGLYKAGQVDCRPRSDTGYRHGAPFAISVIHIDGKPVERSTADAYYKMKQAAARDGVTLRLTSGFRTQGEQRYLYSCYTDCNCNNCNLAAYPGYSNHQSGYALDLNTHEWGVYDWLSRHGWTYGFRRTVPSEDWHWEYFGGAPEGPGPCDGDRETHDGLIRFVQLNPNGVYRNGIWFKTQAASQVHHVRYHVDGILLGASEQRGQSFGVRYTFNTLGQHTVTADAYNIDGQRIGRATIPIQVKEGDKRGDVDFQGLHDGARVRNGDVLEVSADWNIARVVYKFGGWQVGESTRAGEGFPLRLQLLQTGYRAILAVGYDRAGNEVARRSLVLHVLPLDDEGADISFVAPDPDSEVQNPVVMRAVTRGEVAEVVYFAEGRYKLGSSRLAGDNYVVRYPFGTKGRRTIEARALDAEGNVLAREEIEITILP